MFKNVILQVSPSIHRGNIVDIKPSKYDDVLNHLLEYLSPVKKENRLDTKNQIDNYSV